MHKKRSHSSCCVVNCKNRGGNSSYKFYRFPVAQHKLLQRNKWIAAVRRKNPDGSPWCPKPWELICSAHFIGNKKSEEELSPSYIPTIFPSACKAKEGYKTEAIKKYTDLIHDRFMQRRVLKQEPINTKDLQQAIENALERPTDRENADRTMNCCGSHQSSVKKETSVTNQKLCGTAQKTFENQSTGSEIDSNGVTSRSNFAGIESIENDKQLLNLAGVTLDNFHFLLGTLNNVPERCKVTKEDRLLMFLIKMKTGLSFSVIGVLFSVPKTTVSKMFFLTLDNLSAATANLVFWPSKVAVKGTMPDCFRPDFSETRVVLDFAEFRIEDPVSVDNRFYTWSNHKRGFTAKVMVGSIPAGFISYKSKVAGGRKTDAQMLIESGLADLLRSRNTRKER